MSDKKNIDRLFREKFKNFEATPEDSVWEKVTNTLHGDRRDKKPIPVWWKWAGIAAGIILLISVGSYFMFSPTSLIENDQVVDVENPILEKENDQFQKNSTDSPMDKVGNDEVVENIPSKTDKIDQNQVAGSKSDKNVESNSIGPQNSTESNKNISPKNSKEPNTSVAGINRGNQTAIEKPAGNSSKNTENKINAPVNEKTLNSGTSVVAKNDKIIDSENAGREVSDNPISKIASKTDSRTGDSIAQVKLETISGVKSDENPNAIASVDSIKINNNKVKTEANVDGSGTETSVVVTAIDKEVEKTAQQNETDENAVAVLEENNENEIEEAEKLNRWDISPNISPVYFNSLGSGSSIDSQFNENSKTGKINFSYGIKGSYALNNKVKLRAGVNKVDLGYSTDQVIVYRNTNATVNGTERLRYVKFKDDQANTSFISASNLSYAVIPDVIANNIKGSIDQEIGFIEIPLEVEYALFSKRFGLNVIGGFSTFFLNKNEVYATLQRDRTLLGEANNINDISYSANLGLGFNFKFSEKLDFNLEPTFKYQFETFSESAGNFQPYFIGIYSGLRFKF